MVKQVIVMRKDLNMRKGKMIAQGAHASMKVIVDLLEMSGPEVKCHGDIPEWYVTGLFPVKMGEWLKGIFTKICVYVNSEQELTEIYESASEQNIPCAIIEDSGKTEFDGVPTLTCCAIGPDDSEKIDKITGELPLL